MTSTAKLLFNGMELSDTLFEDSLTFTVKAVRADEEDSGRDKNSGTDTGPVDPNHNLKTGSDPLAGAGLTLLMLVSASAIAAASKRKVK